QPRCLEREVVVRRQGRELVFHRSLDCCADALGRQWLPVEAHQRQVHAQIHAPILTQAQTDDSNERAGARDGTRTRTRRCLKPVPLPLDYAGVIYRVSACIRSVRRETAGGPPARTIGNWPPPIP